jgi:hypothetical protein
LKKWVYITNSSLNQKTTKMKTAILLFISILIFPPDQSLSNKYMFEPETITGVYDGLTESMEFQFTTSSGQIYIFDELESDLEYDLYDEMLVGQKFKVTWEKRNMEILDEEDIPTGKTEEIKIIVGLQKL